MVLNVDLFSRSKAVLLSSMQSSSFGDWLDIILNFYIMFRPALNTKTGQIETIQIETCPNLEDYHIIPMDNESLENDFSTDMNWNKKEEPSTRAKALMEEKQMEQNQIEEAVKKNVGRPKKTNE